MPVLELERISKHFGAIHALNDVDLTLEAGEVLGLMGDNGAGKSTLVQASSPAIFRRPTAKSASTASRCISPSRSRRAQKGIEVVYQDLALCNNLSAAANVFLGREIKTRRSARSAGSIMPRWRGAPANCSRELKSETRPRDLVRQMSGGQRQAVAIARTRLSKAKMVLMDEPTAAISVRQVAEVLDLIRRLRDSGMAIILISHRMPDVFAVCDRVAVLRRGTQGRRQADQGDKPRGSDRPDHRRDRDGVRSSDAAERCKLRRAPTSGIEFVLGLQTADAAAAR